MSVRYAARPVRRLHRGWIGRAELADALPEDGFPAYAPRRAGDGWRLECTDPRGRRGIVGRCADEALATRAARVLTRVEPRRGRRG